MRFNGPGLATVLAVSAAALAGCGQHDRTADCPKSGEWTAANNCQQNRTGGGGGGSHGYGFFGFGGGSSGAAPAAGVARGGFGGTAASFGDAGAGE